MRNDLQLNIHEIRSQQAVPEQQAKIEADRHNEQHLVEAVTKVNGLLRDLCQPKNNNNKIPGHPQRASVLRIVRY